MDEWDEAEKFLLQVKEDLKVLLENGVDDWWKTYDTHLELINRLRVAVGLEPIKGV